MIFNISENQNCKVFALNDGHEIQSIVISKLIPSLEIGEGKYQLYLIKFDLISSFENRSICEAAAWNLLRLLPSAACGWR